MTNPWLVLAAMSCLIACGSEAALPRGAGGQPALRQAAQPSRAGVGAAAGAPMGGGGGSAAQAGNPPAGAAAGGAAGEVAGGASGESGAGGEADSAPLCVPHSPCNSVEYQPGKGCVERILPDGAACTDGHVCTAQDHCEKGQCVGSPFSSEPSVVASVRGFGGYSEVGGESTQYGLALPLNERELVFADTTRISGTRLTLVKIDEHGELQPESSSVAPFAITRRSISAWVFAGQNRAQLLRLSDSRFVLLGAAASQVFDVTEGQLQPSTVARFGRETSPRGAVSLLDRYWTCNESGIDAFRVEGTPPVSSAIGSYFADCEALAVSADGHSLFAATHRGLLQLSLADDGGMSLVERWFPTIPFFDVALADGVLVAQDMYAPLGYGTLHAYRWQTMEPIGVYPEADNTSPLLGFAVSNAQAVLERLVAGSENLGISLQRVDLSNFAAKPQEAAFWDRALDYSGYDYIVRPTAGFGLMISQPVRRVWRIGQPGEKSTPLFGHLQGYFESVHEVDEQHAVSLDGHSRHEIDLTLPSAPAVKSTPLLGLQPARLVLGSSNDLGIWRQPAGPPASEFSLASIDRSGLNLHGRVTLNGKRQTLSGDDVVTADFEKATNRFRIQTSPLATLQTGLPQQSLQNSEDFWVVGSDQPAAGFRGVMPAEIGADAGSLVIAERWEGVPNVYLHWLSRAAGKFATDVAQELSVAGVGLAEQVLVRDDRALVVSKSHLLLVARTERGLLVQTSREQLGDAVSLKWTKDFIYVALGSASQPATSLEVLSPSDLSVLHSYALDDQGLSLAEVGSHVVATVRHGFVVLAPPCAVAAGDAK